MRKNAKVKGRWHDNRHTLITELAESGAGDQTIMDIAGHVSKQMLKHYSHIRMEAKRSALESIVNRRPTDMGSQQQEHIAVIPTGMRTKREQAATDQMAATNERVSAASNTENLCSETPTDTQLFDGEYPQKSPQLGRLQICEEVEKPCKSMNLFGGRGRNRTYNLSVKSRMLCQLSYASKQLENRAEGNFEHGNGRPKARCHLKRIAQSRRPRKHTRCAKTGGQMRIERGAATSHAAERWWGNELFRT